MEVARQLRMALTMDTYTTTLVQMHESFPTASEEDMQSARIAFALPMPPGPSTLFMDSDDE